MKKWLRCIRGAVTMGPAWAAGWTLVGMLGVVVFYALSPSAPDVFDIWIPVFAYPGFLAGVGFSVVLRVAEGHRRFEELSLPRLAGWGVVVGLLLGVLAFALGTTSVGFPLWLLGVVIFGSTALLSVVSAVGSVLLFRYVARRKLPAEARPER
jgi:O-antigen/teichoic acid export membrane protein